MFFAGLFSLFAVTMLVAWFGKPRVAFLLFALAMVLTGALYLHHATTILPLSF
jgi:Na+/melibiose symporter-like transporter